MISYGEKPAESELEVSIFGPGFGEAIAIHLGFNRWVLVDSCIYRAVKQPATSHYLDQIGVANSDVKVIVASHWHDDHVRGISELVNKYSAAELHMSAVLNDEESTAFLAAYSGQYNGRLSRGAKELHKCFQLRDEIFYLHHRSVAYEDEGGGSAVRMTAFSPAQAAIAAFIARNASYVPKLKSSMPIGNAPRELPPNLESVVLHIEVGDEAILLGSDLEEHSSYGWNKIISDTWCCSRKRASIYKVAHHGSDTGENPSIWTALLSPGPVTGLTPFKNGNVRLPQATDVSRIKSRSRSAHIASMASASPSMESGTLKRLKQLGKNVQRENPGFGCVRFRKATGASDWSVEIFGDARKL